MTLLLLLLACWVAACSAVTDDCSVISGSYTFDGTATTPQSVMLSYPASQLSELILSYSYTRYGSIGAEFFLPLSS